MIFTTTGSGQTTVPSGLNYLLAQVWGAGGGGSNEGGGGGGGGHALTIVLVTEGQLIDYVVGSGGIGDGGSSTISFHGGDNIVIATGGKAGNGAVGGLGGTGTLGDTLHRGGNGGILTEGGGGGGGGNGRSIINGNNGGSPDRGTPAGGTGGQIGIPPESGNQPGGGGGGALPSFGGAGSGGHGQVSISFFTRSAIAAIASTARLTVPPSTTKFNLSYTPVETVVTPASTISTVTHDVSDNVYHTAVIDNEAIVVVDPNITHTFTNLTPTIASLNTSTGRLTKVSNGTAQVICKTVGLEKMVQVPISRTASVTTGDQTFVSGSLGRHCADVVDNAISGKTASASTQDIYSFINDTTATYVRNTNLWCKDIDFTCVPAAAGNNISSLQGTVVGCLIARDIMLAATHAHYPFYAFVTADNRTIVRSVVAQGQVAGEDIYIQKLDSPLPSSINIAKVLPENLADYMSRINSGILLDDVAIPFIYRHTGGGAYRRFGVAEWKRYNPSGLSGENEFRGSIYANRNPWFTDLQTGDSGSPYLLVINNQPVVLGVWFTIFGGPGVSFFITQINSAITSLGSNSSLNIVDLSEFPTY